MDVPGVHHLEFVAKSNLEVGNGWFRRTGDEDIVHIYGSQQAVLVCPDAVIMI